VSTLEERYLNSWQRRDELRQLERQAHRVATNEAEIARLRKPEPEWRGPTINYQGRRFEIVWDGTSPHLISEQFAARVTKRAPMIQYVYLSCPSCKHTWRAAEIHTDTWWGKSLKPETIAKTCYCTNCHVAPPMGVARVEEQRGLLDRPMPT